MKTAGLLLIVAAGLLLGLMAAGRLRRRVSMLGHVCSRLRKGERVLAAWEGAVEEDGRDAGLTKADRELLRGFGSQLGRTDVEGQIANCRQYGNLLEQRLTEAREAAAHGFGPSAVVTGAGG